MELISLIIIFILALFIGYEIITKVPPTLHTPLMSGSNAISGIAIIAIVATILGFKDNSRGMLRMASILAFFSQGPYASACCLGLVAFALTFALPKIRIN